MKKSNAFKTLFDGCLTIPNALSFLRILLVPVFAVLFMKGDYLWAFITLAFSGFTDFLDGKIARKFNQISNMGKILDPLADKLSQITIAVVFFLTFRAAKDSTIRAFSYIFLVFLVKEAIMVLGSVVMLIFGLRPGAAELPGKLATFAFYTIMGAIMAFGPEIGVLKSFYTFPNWLMITLVSISAVLCVVAFLSYMPGLYQQIKLKEENPENLKKRSK